MIKHNPVDRFHCKSKFLFPVKALSKVFSAKMIKELFDFMCDAGMELPSTFIKKLYSNPWVVYAKPPFGGAKGVIKYLARYASKIAITHHRILSINQDQIKFSYTDYRHKIQIKVLTVSPQEFIRRFVLHFLPKGFCIIRHFGILCGSWKNRIFPDKELTVLKTVELWLNKGLDIAKCSKCRVGNLIMINEIDPVRGPPNKRNPHPNKQFSES